MDTEIKFEPLFDYVLLEPIAAGETPGGIALPEGSDMGLPKGRVIKVGPGKMCEYDGKHMPMYLQPGDIVATGSPEGSGAGRTPQLWMKGGDKLSVEISKIGTLSVEVIDET